MQPNQPLMPEQSLKNAIDRQPLIVAPDALVFEVIALMSVRRSSQDASLANALSGLLEAPRKQNFNQHPSIITINQNHDDDLNIGKVGYI